eukprot:4222126-Alexandrium_andersonii.AAC.1
MALAGHAKQNSRCCTQCDKRSRARMQLIVPTTGPRMIPSCVMERVGGSKRQKFWGVGGARNGGCRR